MNTAVSQRASVAADVTVWLADDRPTRLVYRGIRFRVTDQPTRLEDELAFVTHPLPIFGWRFQATDAEGCSHMFDIRRTDAGWVLLRMYD